MNFSNILSRIAEVDPEIYERTSERRPIIRNWMRGIALTTLPMALGSLFKKAYGQTNDDVIAVLNFALQLEYLEQDFYTKALQASIGLQNPLIPSGLEQSAIMTIRDHENQHVTFLQNVIATAAGGSFAPKPTFDFTGGKGNPGGPFPNVFSSYDMFLALAQTFEDTGVRAYKTAAPTLIQENNILTSALRIHSTEARHAAHIRAMRHLTPSSLVFGTVKPWITGNVSNINNPNVQRSYDGEENTLQANIQITDINGQQITVNPATESFDEPLSMENLILILDPFLVA